MRIFQAKILDILRKIRKQKGLGLWPGRGQGQGVERVSHALLCKLSKQRIRIATVTHGQIEINKLYFFSQKNSPIFEEENLIFFPIQKRVGLGCWYRAKGVVTH